MSAVGYILAAIGGAKALEHLSTSPHDRLLKKSWKKTYRNAEVTSTHDDAGLYVAHIDSRKADGHTKGVVTGVDGAPDIVVYDPPHPVVFEIEDAKGLQKPQRVIEQLDNYQRRGVRRVLVVPDAEETRTVAEGIVEETSGTVHIATPSSLTDHL